MGQKDSGPWLEVLAGPLAGQVFPLAVGVVTVGREPDNTIVIMDGALSRHHCLFRQESAGKWLVEDTESRNGVFVDDEQITGTCSLGAGVRVRIGKSILCFRTSLAPSTGPVEPDRLGAGSGTLVLRRDESRYLRRELTLPATPRTVTDLEILGRFSREAAAHRTREALESSVLEAATRGTGADRAVFWRVDDEPTATLSRTIRDQVQEEGVAVLCNNVAGDETLAIAESLVASQVHSVMAVPVAVHDRMFGILHVDAHRSVTFDQEHLELVSALGSIAAVALANLDHLEQLTQENQRLKEELNLQFDMVGDAAAMQPVYQFISRVAPRETTALVWGESGTGKELVARALHRNSPRADKPFVAINCAAITDTLLESELFGHEKGAFTGAATQKRGKFEVAEGGTVFLDEIGELAPGLQAKLLRVLQEREFERVGGTKPIKANIRVVAATNRDLKEASKRREFREDLYYRLNVVSIKMPALRERREDIPRLAQFFADRFSEKIGRKVDGVSAKARAYMMQYDWPGNVRELENTIERAVVLGVASTIQPEDLPDSLLEGPSPGDEPAASLHAAVREAKKRAVLQALDQTGGSQTEAAKLLGVHAVHLSRLIKSLGLKVR